YIAGFRVLLRQGRGEDPGRTEGLEAGQGPHQDADLPSMECLHGIPHRTIEPFCPGVDGLFPGLPDTGKVQGLRRMVQAKDAPNPVEGMEETSHPRGESEQTR